MSAKKNRIEAGKQRAVAELKRKLLAIKTTEKDIATLLTCFSNQTHLEIITLGFEKKGDGYKIKLIVAV